MSESEILKIKITGIKEMLEELNAVLPFANNLSYTIIRNYLKELEEKLNEIKL